ncbi:carboxypeptidase-like regulatory domain-containing protein, partial [Arthrospira platensis SPKY2]
MSKKYFLLFLFTGLSFSIFAQNAQIKGKVIAENYPVEGATVQVQKSNNGVVTDVNGNFTIKNLEAGTYTLEVNFIGFERYTQRVTLKANQLLELTIELKSDL